MSKVCKSCGKESATVGDYCPGVIETATGRVVKLDENLVRLHDQAVSMNLQES